MRRFRLASSSRADFASSSRVRIIAPIRITLAKLLDELGDRALVVVDALTLDDDDPLLVLLRLRLRGLVSHGPQE